LKKVPKEYIIIQVKNRKKRGKKMATREKNVWILVLFILSGLVIGGLLGELTKGVSYLSWLSYGQEFGLTSPITLNLNIVQITFGLMVNINIASIIGVLIAVFVYRKI